MIGASRKFLLLTSAILLGLTVQAYSQPTSDPQAGESGPVVAETPIWSGQDWGGHTGNTPPQGQYEPFTLWRKIQLGATGYLKPEVASQAQVVWSHSPDNAEEFLQSVEAGSIPAKQSSDNVYVTMDKVEEQRLISDVMAGKIDDSVKLLSFERPESATSEKLIHWPHLSASDAVILPPEM